MINTYVNPCSNESIKSQVRWLNSLDSIPLLLLPSEPLLLCLDHEPYDDDDDVNDELN